MRRKTSAGDTDHLLEEEAVESSEEDVADESERGRQEEPVGAESHPEGLGDVHGPRYFCGVGRCRPKWLQVLARGNVFTFLLCMNALIEGALVSGQWMIVAMQ